MPKKTKYAPQNYYDMKGSVDKQKKVKHSEVFGKKTAPNKTKKKTTKKKSSY